MSNDVDFWNDVIAREFFRGLRNGAMMGFVVGFAVACLLLLVVEGA